MNINGYEVSFAPSRPRKQDIWLGIVGVAGLVNEVVEQVSGDQFGAEDALLLCAASVTTAYAVGRNLINNHKLVEEL